MQTEPSEQGALFDPCRHDPAPSHRSSVQTFPSLVHAVPAASKVHVALQQSPPLVLPSSQASPGATTPLPHALIVQFTSQPSPSSRSRIRR